MMILQSFCTQVASGNRVGGYHAGEVKRAEKALDRPINLPQRPRLSRLFEVALGHLREQSLRIVGDAAAINGFELAQIADVTDRIAVDYEHIGKAPGRERSKIVLLT